MKKIIVNNIYNYIKNMRNPQENILEILLVAQKEADGFIPKWLQLEISDIIDISLEEIKETIDFFEFLRENKEKDKVEICTGISCYMAGNSLNEILLKKELEEDLIYSECQDVCEYGPRIKVGDKIFHFVDENNIKDIVNYINKGGHNER